ncbi:YheC/YheD family protein [Cytobacillus sp. IB215316]|uniref:YheC/YheD family endospore coat-associated protein n=1 Tax=Cytobacillus sp. IB215316 TaxID=3097354 RepID=UPI002A0C1D7D|nr:YheC/YheD family protein [Cytobacillus sp. IB215316]MDX8363346.1 YheC/YheD family protein [Cytobacillus sp. IB215316]
MKQLYYDPHSQEWHQSFAKDTPFFFGQNKQLTTYVETKSSSLIHFPVLCNGSMIGPLIGIMTSASKKGKAFSGNHHIFRQIQEALQSLGGVCVVFSYEGIRSNGITGYVYYKEKKGWLQIHAPLPHIIYNRIPSQEDEQLGANVKAIKFFQDRKIPILNPSFFLKQDVFSSLAENNITKKYLPETSRLQNPRQCLDMLYTYGVVYIKPNRGCKGEGIKRVTIMHNDTVQVEDVKTTEQFSSIDTFLHAYPILFNGSYLIQQAIDSDEIDQKRYDLRIFAHKQAKHFIISGIGVRQSITQDVTTHVPNGGKLLPFETIQDRINKNELYTLVDECGQALNKKMGFIGEFSIDIGRSKEGLLYIYEINSKPMVFDEKAIQKNGINNLVQLFQEVTAFKTPS